MVNFDDLHELPEVNEAAASNEQQFPCQACNGTGIWKGGYINRVQGKCHTCNGRGYFKTSPEFRAKAKQQRNARAAQRQLDVAKAAGNFIEDRGIQNLLKWVMENKQWNTFAESLWDQLYKKGQWSDNQIAALERMIQKSEETKKAKAKATVEVDLTKLHELFNTAKASGLKKPALTIGLVRVSLAPATGKNAGYLYVKKQGGYQGKVSPEGKFFTVRDADKKIGATLTSIAADPVGQLRSIGRDTGVCCCCGRELTKQDSIDAGIGPVCADNWGL